MSKNVLKIMTWIVCMVIATLNLSNIVMAAESNNKIPEEIVPELEETKGFKFSDEESDYGALYGAQYSEEDTSEWLTLQLGGRGLRIINEEGNDVVLVDQFGGLYINGQAYSAGDSGENAAPSSFSLGFIYFLVIISLILGVVNIIAVKKY